MKFNKIVIIFIVIFTLIFLVCVILLLKQWKELNDNNADIEELAQNSFKENEKTGEIEIDWDYLKSVNEDIVGWINIENTVINYPILKDNSNLYYLKYNYLKKYNSNGSIITLSNSTFCNSSETIIYGHNMENGSMFSSLSNYLNENFLLSHQKIEIYTPYANYEGIIFSAYTDSVLEEESISNLSFSEKIEHYISKSEVNINDVSIREKVIKLITCSYINATTNPTNQRYYIIATLNEVE